VFAEAKSFGNNASRKTPMAPKETANQATARRMSQRPSQR
jgi:hypothetical protein